MPRYNTQHYSTLQSTTLITPHHNYNCNCNYVALITLHYNYHLKLQLHYTTTTTTSTSTATTATTTALLHTTSSSCGPGDRSNRCNHSKKHSSNHLSVHQWIRSAIRDSQQPTSPIGFPFLKLPPPSCAVLLVNTYGMYLHIRLMSIPSTVFFLSGESETNVIVEIEMSGH